MTAGSAPAAPRRRCVESFRSAADCIGRVTAGDSLFAVTRGQWSMVDVVLHLLEQTGPGSIVSIWPRVISAERGDIVARILAHPNVAQATLVVHAADAEKSGGLMSAWRDKFGASSVRFANTHAKIATVEGGGLAVMVRGSMNLTIRPQFEQYDLTEGGADFRLVRAIEESLPTAADEKKQGPSRSPTSSSRAARAQATLKAAGSTIGPIAEGSAIFAPTWGEFSLLDAILHAVEIAGECIVTVWTWTIAEYEIAQLARHPSIKGATLFIDADSKSRVRNNVGFAAQWRDAFGADSIRYIISHAKMATIESATRKILIRGSANANQNNRMEQLDVTEGGPDFDLVRTIEGGLRDARADEPRLAYAASKVSPTAGKVDLALFDGIRSWAK